jgi:hypothetical protein
MRDIHIGLYHRNGTIGSIGIAQGGMLQCTITGYIEGKEGESSCIQHYLLGRSSFQYDWIDNDVRKIFLIAIGAGEQMYGMGIGSRPDSSQQCLIDGWQWVIGSKTAIGHSTTWAHKDVCCMLRKIALLNIHCGIGGTKIHCSSVRLHYGKGIDDDSVSRTIGGKNIHGDVPFTVTMVVVNRRFQGGTEGDGTVYVYASSSV